MHVILYFLSLVNLLHSITRWNSLLINSYIIIKSFEVMLTLICWSVDLPETFAIGNIYQAQNNTFKQKNCKIC